MVNIWLFKAKYIVIQKNSSRGPLGDAGDREISKIYSY